MFEVIFWFYENSNVYKCQHLNKFYMANLLCYTHGILSNLLPTESCIWKVLLALFSFWYLATFYGFLSGLHLVPVASMISCCP